MTWPEYLGVVLGFQEQEENEEASDEPMSAADASARFRRARDSVTGRIPQ